MIRRPPRSTRVRSSAASDVYKRQGVLGIRVKSAEEHDAVAAWLKQDPTHRAVLFHTAGYPDGYRLFAEFPAQTSFGDIAPAFE